MTTLLYAINGLNKAGEPARETADRQYYPAQGSIDKVIEEHKTEIKKLQEMLGWTNVTVSYRGQVSD